MAAIELLKQNLAIEPDLQNFIGFVLTAVKLLGGNPFAAAPRALELMEKLRRDGAATGYPLPARLTLEGARLFAQWGENGEIQIATLPHSPAQDMVEQLRQHFQYSTEVSDPAILLRRNAEMMRYLEETRARTEKEIEAMQQALAKRQEELWESLHQAETDPLTGLLNRRAFDERFEQAFKRTLRQKNEKLSLVLLDLDFFKQINDEYGHQFGDAYLNKMAHAMRDAIRQDVDLAFRIGGDEFALLLFADGATSCRRAMQILASMDKRVSVGVASLFGSESPDKEPADLFRRADEALYWAKRSGRGRVVVDSCTSPDFEGCCAPCAEV